MSRELCIYASMTNCRTGRRFEASLFSMEELKDYVDSGNFSLEEAIVNGVSFNIAEVRKVLTAFF